MINTSTKARRMPEYLLRTKRWETLSLQNNVRKSAEAD